MEGMRKFYSVVLGALLALALAVPVFADSAVVDYSTDITTALTGLVAGVAASIAAAFAIAALVRVTFKAARIGLKAIGLVR